MAAPADDLAACAAAAQGAAAADALMAPPSKRRRAVATDYGSRDCIDLVSGSDSDERQGDR
jgi:uncharacterized protein YgiB involved in biofilm formation